MPGPLGHTGRAAGPEPGERTESSVASWSTRQTGCLPTALHGKESRTVDGSSTSHFPSGFWLESQLPVFLGSPSSWALSLGDGAAWHQAAGRTLGLRSVRSCSSHSRRGRAAHTLANLPSLKKSGARAGAPLPPSVSAVLSAPQAAVLPPPPRSRQRLDTHTLRPKGLKSRWGGEHAPESGRDSQRGRKVWSSVVQH